MLFAFTVVPQAELCTRTDSAGTADNYAKEFAQKMFRRIHAQFPTRRNNRFPQHFEAAQFFKFERKINFFTSKVLLVESTNDIEVPPCSEKKCAGPKIQ